MFIGHYAVSFAAKRIAPHTSLGTLMAAALLLDLLWPILVLVGWEEVRIEPGNTRFTPLNFISYPISHGLVAAIGWATLFAALYYLFARYWRGTLVVWLLVLSHWVLDFVTHRADMPLYANGPKVGLGLWNSVVGTVAVEGLLYAAGVFVYFRVTRAKDSTGKWACVAFVIAMAALYVANIFSPPPPGVKPLLIGAIPFGLVPIAWGWWVDHHREPRFA